jgi:hydrogenase nickel incorporation protein HypB
MKIRLMQKIMGDNKAMAEENRGIFAAAGVRMINIMASPGAGKTSVISAILNKLRDEVPMGVIEGDIASSIDAEKVEKLGFPAVQINTGGGCHLDANVIREAYNELGVPSGMIFIENVGNLICPSSFDLGESLRVVISSVPEGDDKPFKYLSMFAKADVVVLNKCDLMPYIDFKLENFKKGLYAINTQNAPLFIVSCTTGEGIDELVEFLRN